jgi:WD40 repeat protein
MGHALTVPWRASAVRIWVLWAGPAGAVASASSADSKVLWCVSGSGQTCSWDMLAGDERPGAEEPALGPGGIVLALSDDATTLLGIKGFDPEKLLVWDVAADKLIRTIATPGKSARWAAFSADKSLLAVGLERAYDRGTPPDERQPYRMTLRVFETATGREVFSATPEGESRVGSMAFSPDGKRLVTGMEDSTILVWELSKP